MAVIKANRKSSWKLVVISGLFNMRMNRDDFIQFFEWIGSATLGCPTCFRCSTWDQMKGDFMQRDLLLSCIHSLHFVNQVRGIAPMDGAIRQDTRNSVDGGVQCSLRGPDVLNIPNPTFDPSKSITFKDCTISEGDTHYSNLLVPNKSMQKANKRKKIKRTIPEEECDDVKKFHLPSNRIIDSNQLGLVLIVKDEHGRDITSSLTTATPSQLKDTLNFGSVKSASDMSSSLQHFFSLTEESYDNLCSNHCNGLEVGIKYEDTIDEVVSSYSSSTHILLSTDKIQPPDDFLGIPYYEFVRIFAGPGSPDVDKTFHECRVVDGFVIYHKFTRARDFSQYVPLSIGFHDTTYHAINIIPLFVEKIEKCLSNKGIYTSRSSMLTKGGQSFIGLRKTDGQRQPSVSEGPVDRSFRSSKPKDVNFIYYRQTIKLLYWPFVLSLMNFLGGITSIAAYYFYHHLAKLYTFSNDMSHNIRFCTTAILTINFCCSCHCDLNDLQPWCREDITRRLRIIICRFESLKEKGIPVQLDRLLEAKVALEHVLSWGISNPTTCCYQYITERNNTEVYQWFMCPGLGTTHRIKNYWVHIMLACLFSHCTSSAIYVVDGRAYFGRCPLITMFAWGVG